MKKIIKRLYYIMKNYKNDILLKSGCNIGGFSTVFEGSNIIGHNTIFSGYIGFGSYIGDNSNIEGIIGKYCSIASRVNVITGNHPTYKFVSTHPAFFQLKNKLVLHM